MRNSKIVEVQNQAAARLIRRTLRELEGNVAMAARRLKLTRRGLVYRMEQLGIDAEKYRREVAE